MKYLGGQLDLSNIRLAYVTNESTEIISYPIKKPMFFICKLIKPETRGWRDGLEV